MLKKALCLLAVLVILLSFAAPSHAATNYRSIGTDTGTLAGGDSSTAAVAQGLTVVTFAGVSLPANIGKGDKLTLDPSGANEVRYIFSRDSATQVTLQSAVENDHSGGVAYTITRAYNTIQAWEDDRDGDLVAEDRKEIGVCYNDGPFLAGTAYALVTIDDSITDAEHFMWLTVAEGHRHDGTAGAGVVIDGQDTAKIGIRARNDYTRIDGLEIKRFRSDNGAAGIEVEDATQVYLSELIIHDFDSAASSVVGIKGMDNSEFTARNCIIYDGDTAGIRITQSSGTALVENCTIYAMAGRGLYEDDGVLTVTNTISMGNNQEDFDIVNGQQSYNLSADATAQGPGSLSNIIVADQFVSITVGTEDLHLKEGSDAIDAGQDLSAQFNTDIDGDIRPIGTAWDIGSDEGGSAPSNSAPTEPTAPYCNDDTAQSGQANPTEITDPTPAFSAIYNDPDPGDIANKYRIEINTQSDFSGMVMWDSGANGTSMTNTTAGSRSADIIYAGSPLSDNTTYYWRIRFWDDSGAEGAPVAAQNFTTGTFSTPAVPINYRSIGTDTGTLAGGDSSTAAVAQGLTQVTFSGVSLPANIGQGDKLTLDPSGANEVRYIFSRDSATQVTLQSAVENDHSGGVAYTITRAYNTIQAWEDDRDGDLVAEDRKEIGVCYNDGPFLAGTAYALVTIDDSITDAEHFMWLTVAEGHRHDGTAGAGVVIDGQDTAKIGIRARNDYTRIDGLEIKRFRSDNGAAGIEVEDATQVYLSELIIHDFDSAASSVVGIKGMDNSEFTARNCIIYDGDTAGIRITQSSGTALVENCTIYAMAGRGLYEDDGVLTVTNTISMGNNQEDFDIVNGQQSYNLSADATAQGPGSLSNKIVGDQFVSITAGAEDLHLKEGSDVIDAGQDLSAQFNTDIDGESRPIGADWDMGADEFLSQASNAPSVTMSSTPETIKVGESATLFWDSTDADSGSINQGVGGVPATGSTIVSPSVTTTYTITVTGPGGIASAQATVFVEDFFTFTQNVNELDNQTLTFTPDGSPNFYSACTDAATAFFTDPTGGTTLNLYFDDYQMVTLTGGVQVSLYGVNYSSFYVGSNGYITFTEGDTDNSDSFADHFDTPRISGLFADHAPAYAGNISWKQLSDRVAVTFQNVLHWGTFSYNSFQIEMFFDGTIRLTYLMVGAEGGIAGLSAGAGIPDGFVESDMSAFGSCLLPLNGDFDVDGDVDEVDRAVFDADLGRTDCMQGEPCEGDFDGDGDVDEVDQAVFDANFGRTDGHRAIPDVVGLDQATAQSTIVSAGLTVGTTTTEYSDTVPSDHVISQNPAAATLVSQGSSVDLLVSLGPHPPTVVMSVNPEYILDGESATLSWTSTRADTAAIDQGLGVVDVSGSITVSPTVTTTYTITVTGPGGTATDSVNVNIITPPVVSITDPLDGAVSNEATITVSGTVDGYNPTVMVNGISASVSGGTFTAVDVPLTSDENSITAVATNQAGSGTDTINVTYVEPGAPVVYITNPPDRTVLGGSTVTISGTVNQNDSIVLVNGISATIQNGLFTAVGVPLNPGANRITATASNQIGTDTDKIWVVLEYQYEPQPDGSFGGQYEDLIPPDAMVASYDPQRFSLVTGLVQDPGGSPITDVLVTILDHLEYGTAITDVDGRFSIPVEGGGILTLSYEKAGLISAQRKVEVPWNDTAVAETVHMISQDPASTTVTFDGNPNTVITHQSTEVTDGFGNRSATVVFTGENRAYEVDDKGQVIRELTTITTRATEFTTPESMPAILPPTSGYTYCVELGADGVERVKFEEPVTMWVDNFLGFDVGMAVPVGYYDRDRGVWVPEENGKVVKLLDTNSDDVIDALDADGDNQPDDLNEDGSFSDEVKGLDDSQSYQSGATYWRVALSHFSPHDLNWAFRIIKSLVPLAAHAPEESITPNPDSDPYADQQGSDEKPCNTPIASFVDDRARIIHEDIPIPGTPMTLHYASNRGQGYRHGITVPASGETVPEGLKRIVVKLNVAGRTLEQVLDPLPNQFAEFYWDGLDHLGKRVVGTIDAEIEIGFAYDGVYTVPPDLQTAFAMVGGDLTSVLTRQDVILWKRSSISLSAGNPGKVSGVIADGWTLSHHHQFSEKTFALHKGDGSVAGHKVNIIKTVAGGGESFPDGIPATEAQIYQPYDVAMDNAGNLYIAQAYNHRILKVASDGIVTIVAGGGNGFEEGILATEAWLCDPRGVAVDADGNIYISDHGNGGNHRVRKVDPNGIITTVAGAFEYFECEVPYRSDYQVFGGDDGPATQARLLRPRGLKLDSEGNLYIADTGNHRIRKIDTNGIITTVAGSGPSDHPLQGGGGGYSGDGGLATEAQLDTPHDIAVDVDGNLYIADAGNYRIRKVDTSGIITTYAGNGILGYSGDGGEATQAQLKAPTGVSLDAFGNLYIYEYARVRKVDTSGIITTVAGNGDWAYGGDGGIPTEAQLSSTWGGVLDAAGNLYIADTWNHRIRKVGPPSRFSEFVTAGDITFSEENGLGHIMSVYGQHKKTIDLDTGVVLYDFGYDENNNLVSITDQFGNQTVIERDGNGVPTAIISPDGITTVLTIDGNNHLTIVTYPDNGYYTFEYTTDGLMTAKIEPEANRFTHSFDSVGRLTDVTDDEGGHWNFTRTSDENSDILTEVLSGEGNLTSYFDHTDSTGTYTSTITDPTGAQTLFTSSASGLTVSKSLPCGMDLHFEYGLDSEYKFKFVKEMTETTPAGLTKTTIRDKTYEDTDTDAVPDLISENVTVNGKLTTLVADTLQATKTITSPAGRTVTTVYDANTLLTTSLSIPGLHDTAYGYDIKGKLTSIATNTRQTTFAYNAQGFLESITNPENHTTTYSYDAVGRMTGISRPDTSSVAFTYDLNGNMTVLTNPSDISHDFGYNRVNLNSSYTTPLSGSYGYVYDRDRRLTQVNFPSGKQINNIYANGRLEQIQTPEGNIDLTYLCGTKVDTIQKGTETITYGYDGSLVTSETLGGTLNNSLSYSYDSDFNLSSFTYAGVTVNYAYDNDGLLTDAEAFTISRYAGNGLPDAVTDGALNLSRTFSGYGEVEAQDFTVGSQGVTSWSVTRDNTGRITAKTETVDGVTSSYDYTYGPMGRLLTVTKDGTLVEEYVYDSVGTRISEVNSLRGITSRSMSYSDEDNLLTAGDASYQYDLDGYLTTRTVGTEAPYEVTSYAYSSRGELLSVTLPDGRIIEYLHDPLGRRIAKKVNGSITEKYLWQGLTRLLAVYDGSDNLLMRFLYVDDRMPVAMEQGGASYYLTYDQVGSLRVVADAPGNVIKRINYDSFGNIIADNNPIFEVPFGFAGGLYDRDTGLVRFGFRDYDPDVGRWTAKDPILFAGGDTDLYGYALNNPVNLIDADGLQPGLHFFLKQIFKRVAKQLIPGREIAYPMIQQEMDTDSDGDGINDHIDPDEDYDGDGVPNYLDPDDDNDGIGDNVDYENDIAKTRVVKPIPREIRKPIPPLPRDNAC